MSFDAEGDTAKLLVEAETDEESWLDESHSNVGRTDGTQIFPHTYVVLKFSNKAASECIEWLATRIQAARDEGGAELLVRRQPLSCDKDGSVILHVSASRLKLLEVAEEMEVRVKDLKGNEKEFMIADIEDYIPQGYSGAVEELFPMSERQRIVHRQIHISLRALSSEDHIPGHPKMTLKLGESIVQALLREGLLKSQYILHDEEALKKLGPKWYGTIFGRQPLDEIHTYFGEAVTLYFTFLGYYTKALCIPMVLGFLQIIFATTIDKIFFLPFFCLFNVLWVTVFLEAGPPSETCCVVPFFPVAFGLFACAFPIYKCRHYPTYLWKQKCSELAFAWGTIGMTSLDEPRPGFRGEMKEDPITMQLLPQYPRWKTNIKMYLVSIPIVLFCLLVAFYIMLLSFWIDDYLCRTHWMGFLEPLKESYEEGEGPSFLNVLLHQLLPLLPSTLYAVLVYSMNLAYRHFATVLTDWENHRTQSQFDRHRVSKLILFEFVNNFMSLFYIAFYLHDMAMLKFQLALMLIFLQVINNVQEALLPICISKVRSSLITKKDSSGRNSKSSPDGDKTKSEGLRQRKSLSSGKQHSIGHSLSDAKGDFLGHIPCLDEDDPRIEQAIKEGEKATYEGTYDDYLELFMQFGYVFLFASAYPAAAFWAVLNNVLEIRTDAFKLCHILQRPLAKRVKDTGAWQRAFEAMGSLSVMTNCALLGISVWKAYSVDAVLQFKVMNEADAGDVEPLMESEEGATHWGPMGLSLIHWALVIVAVEHFLLMIQCLINYGIPDRPEHIRVSLARQAFCSKQALKQQKYIQSRKQLRRNKTVHGAPHHNSPS